MKKLLLTAAAAMSCAFMANAESYTVTAQAYEDPDYAAWDYTLLADYAIDIEVNDTYVVLKNWLQVEGEDLRVEFNEDGDVTDFIPVVNGVDGNPDYTMGDGLIGIETSNPAYNYFFLYTDYSGVSIDPEDEDGCYVFIYGAGYDQDWEEIEGYFDWEWEPTGSVDEGELWYTVQSKATNDEDWDNGYYDFAFCPEGKATIDVYDNNSVIIKGWTGSENNGLYVKFDDDENVINVELLDKEGNVVTYRAEGYEEDACGYIDNPDYYYVDIYVAPQYGYAYANAEEGYVILSMYLYDEEDNYYWAYYNIEWPEQENGILDVATDNSAAVYYNINGMRVDNPTAAGLYIKRQGNKAVKVVVK